MYLLHLRVFLSFLQIIQSFNYPEKHISQLTSIIDSLQQIIFLSLRSKYSLPYTVLQLPSIPILPLRWVQHDLRTFLFYGGSKWGLLSPDSWRITSVLYLWPTLGPSVKISPFQGLSPSPLPFLNYNWTNPLKTKLTHIQPRLTSTMKMAAVCSSEMLTTIFNNTRCHSQNRNHLYNYIHGDITQKIKNTPHYFILNNLTHTWHLTDSVNYGVLVKTRKPHRVGW
jgi:hypothetical protein